MPAGTVVFAQGADPVEHVWVVRTGAVEIVHDGRVLDLVGPGELFGHVSMLSGLPTGVTARAAEDTVCCRIRGDAVAPLLAQPAGLRYVARSLVQVLGSDASDPPADAGLAPGRRAPALPARGMRARHADPRGRAADGRGAHHVGGRRPRRRAARHPHGPRPAHPGGRLRARHGRPGGDGDERARLHRPGRPPRGRGAARHARPRHPPPARACRRPAACSACSRTADLVAVVARSSFQLRAAIGRATTRAEVVEAVARLRPAIVGAARRARGGEQVARSFGGHGRGLRRLFDLAVAEAGEPPVPFAWFALGSVARREAVP